MWLLLTLGAYFFVAVQTGPGSGLLPTSWDEVICFCGGIVVVGWQAWSMIPADVRKEWRGKRKRNSR